MRQVKIRLNPTLDKDHTEVTITCSLPRQLTAWEMRDLCEMLGARSGKSVRVVLPAVGASSGSMGGAPCWRRQSPAEWTFSSSSLAVADAGKRSVVTSRPSSKYRCSPPIVDGHDGLNDPGTEVRGGAEA